MNDKALKEIALSKVIKDKEYKALVPMIDAGQYPILLRVEISGMIKKGEPFEKRVAAAANPWALLARALSKLNNTTIEALVRESLAVSEEEQTEVKRVAEEAIRTLVDSTKRTMEGQVTGILSYKEV